LNDEITRAWSGMSTRQYKSLKGLKKENLRDNMTTLELVLNMLAEATTTEFSKQEQPEGFEESRQYYKQPEKLTVTGTPVRGEFARYTRESARRELGIPDGKPLVVSVWGSLGAGHMNDMICGMIPLMDSDCDFRLIHSAGSGYYKKLISRLDETDPHWRAKGADVREYIYDMPRVMAAADLIMCRAGASTISELSYMGKPVIMVPSPNVTNNHQEKNARVLEKAGGARVLLEGEFDPASLLETVEQTLSDRAGLERMAQAMYSLALPDATDRICEIILSLIK